MAQTQSDLPQAIPLTAPKRRLPFLALAVFLAWGPSIAGDFVWLDHAEIKFGQARVLDRYDFKAVWSQSLDQYLERNEGTLNASGGYFRPLYCLSLSLDWLIGQQQPAWFHIENLLWHILVAWLLYRVGCSLFAAEQQGEGIAFWAAIAFAVHPMCAQSVAWICGRKDLLCAAGGLGALLLFVSSLRKAVPDDADLRLTFRDWLPVVFSPVLLALAILSKELAFVLPAVATVWFWFRPDASKVGWRPTASNQQHMSDYDVEEGDPDHYQTESGVPTVVTRWRGFVCLALLWSVAGGGAVFRSSIVNTQATGNDGGVVARLGLGEGYPVDSVLGRTQIAAGLVATYVVKSLLPFSPTIVDRWPTETGTTFTLAASAVVLGGLVWLVVMLRRRALVGFGAAWFVIWILPASGVIPLRHLYAERYMYPAMWGPLAVVSLLFFRHMPVIVGDPVVRRKRIMAFMSVVFLGVTSFDQTKYWKDDKELFGHALQQDPNYVEGNIAMARMKMEEPADENYAAAIKYAKQAVQSQEAPGYKSYGSPFVNYNLLGLSHYYLKQYKPAQAAFEKVCEARPRNVVGHYHLGLAALGLNDLHAAETHLKAAIQIQPGHFLARSNLGVVFLRTRRSREAVEILNPLVIAEPDNPTNRLNIGNAFLVERDFHRAAFHFEAVTALVPRSGMVWAKLAWAQWRLGQRHPALLSIGRAIKLDKQDPVVRQIGKDIRDEEIQSQIRAGTLRPVRKPNGQPAAPKPPTGSAESAK